MYDSDVHVHVHSHCIKFCTCMPEQSAKTHVKGLLHGMRVGGKKLLLRTAVNVQQYCYKYTIGIGMTLYYEHMSALLKLMSMPW